MDLREVFQILGIEQTKDERTIKNAYREKLTVTNPEDNPEGFKRLRSAYEHACSYARTEEEEGEEKEQDLSPSGIWVEKAVSIYNNIHTRQDLDAWKALFEEDTFLSLEDEENCRRKLLHYLMDHYKLPGCVWKLFDEKMAIVAEADKLREVFPADFIRYIVGKCERGEDVEFSQFEGEPQAPYDLFLQYYDRCWQALQAGDLQQAREYIAHADELQIYHPVMEICRLNLLWEEGEKENAVKGALALYDRYPKDAMVSYNVAEIFWKSEMQDAAAEIYKMLKADNDSHYMSNVRLSKWYYDNGSYKEAKKCAESVLSAGADDGFMELLTQINHEIEKELEERYDIKTGEDWEAGLELGWCCLQDGKISRGIRIAESLEGKVAPERETERKGLLTKLLIEEAEYEQAIELSKEWQKSLEEKIKTDEEDEERERDEDRIRQSYLIRMQSYRALGYADEEKFALAVSEAECIETGTSRDVGLMLEKAQIYMEMEEYEKSLDLVNRLVEEYQIYAAYATSLEVYRRQWNAAGVIQSGRQCLTYFPTYVRAYEYMAKVYLDLKHKEELLELFAEAEKNGVKSVFLDAYRYQLKMTGDLPEWEQLDRKLEHLRKEYVTRVNNGDEEAYRQVLPMLNEWLYMFPGSYMLVERGILHRAAHRYEEARADFEKALADNPAQVYALRGLSFVHKYQGNYEKALFCIKKAILYWDEEMDCQIFADLGNLYSLVGDHDRAVAAYRQYENQQKKISGRVNVYFMEKLAECLGRAGRAEEAEALLLKLHTQNAVICEYDKLVEICQNTGLSEKSMLYLEKWEKTLFEKVKGLEKLSPKRSLIKKGDKGYVSFLNRRAWQELMYGTPAKALEWFDSYVEAAKKAGEARHAWCDAAFAAILCEDEKRGRNFSAKLRLWLHKEKSARDPIYYNMPMAHLQIEILAAWYTENNEKLQELLDRQNETEICHFCTHCICKEMEAMRILLLMRMGKPQDAKARLLGNLEKQPVDEYMIAIRHVKWQS